MFGKAGDGGLAKAIAGGQSLVDQANKKIDGMTSTENMAVTASVINITGVGSLNGANASNAFTSSGGNPAAVGGITPTPLAPPTPMFEAAPTSLGSITASAIPLAGFGAAGLGASAALGGGGLGGGGINQNSLAAFGQLVNLQNPPKPTPANIGVAPLGDTSAQIMKQLMDQGATAKQASTLTAQFAGESNFDPRARAENDAGTGQYANASLGISQWNNGKYNDTINGRKALMMRDVERQTGKPYDSVGTDELRRAQTNYALKEAQTPRYKDAWDSIGQHPGNEGSAFGRKFEGYDSSTAHGDAWRNQKQLELERKANGLQNPKPSAGIDHDPTGSINPPDLKKTLDPQMKAAADDYKKDMEQASKQLSPELTKDFSKDIQAASSAPSNGGGAGGLSSGDTASSNGSGGSSGLDSSSAGALSSIASLGSGIAKLGSQSKVSAQGITSMIPAITKLLTSLLGGLGGSLGGAGAAGATVGAFAEGGISTEPVSSAFWAGLPAFAEGTPNTSGGFMAQLHPNEAVIPLTRGRHVSVDLQGAGGGDTHNHITNNLRTNVVAANADSFRLNRNQIMSQMNVQISRMAARNN